MEFRKANTIYFFVFTTEFPISVINGLNIGQFKLLTINYNAKKKMFSTPWNVQYIVRNWKIIYNLHAQTKKKKISRFFEDQQMFIALLK